MDSTYKVSVVRRIEEFRSYCGISKSTLAASIGIEQTTLNNQLIGKRGLSLDTVSAMLKAFSELSAEWLLRGYGDMFKVGEIEEELPMPPTLKYKLERQTPIQPITLSNTRKRDGSLNSKIREIISAYNLSDRQFALTIGVSQSVIGSMFQKGTEPSAGVIRNTLKAFPDISSDWFLRDKGEMLISEKLADSQIAKIIKNLDNLKDQIKQLQLQLTSD